MEKVTFGDLKESKDWEKAVIVFTKESFDKEYSEMQRSYEISRSCKYFQPDKIGNSLFGDCLDGTDLGVRLDDYIHALENSWKIEYCYIIK